MSVPIRPTARFDDGRADDDENDDDGGLADQLDESDAEGDAEGDDAALR